MLSNITITNGKHYQVLADTTTSVGISLPTNTHVTITLADGSIITIDHTGKLT